MFQTFQQKARWSRRIILNIVFLQFNSFGCSAQCSTVFIKKFKHTECYLSYKSESTVKHTVHIWHAALRHTNHKVIISSWVDAINIQLLHITVFLYNLTSNKNLTPNVNLSGYVYTKKNLNSMLSIFQQ